jgi:hypothetical protein
MKQFTLIIIFSLLAISCQKDEPATDIVQPEKEYVPVELRNGQDENVFFDGSGVFASATASGDSIQTVINLAEYDSIQYRTTWTSPAINVQGVECWRYNMKFWRNGQVSYERTAFAKYRGITYSQIIGQNEGWNENVLFFHAVKTPDWAVHFDHECMKFKIVYMYQRRIFYTFGNPAVVNEFIKSNSCTRNTVQYPRKFKP